jgi:N-acetyl-alpha-D-muramate 1-phosphate uridylyltransferase
MRYIDWGLTALKADVLKQWPAETAFDLSDVYSDLSRRGELAGYEITTRFYEIGSMEGLRQTEELLRKRSSSIAANSHKT